MKQKIFKILFFSLLTILFFNNTNNLYAQKITRVRGVVIDANTKEPLPFVNIVFVGKNIGTITD